MELENEDGWLARSHAGGQGHSSSNYFRNSTLPDHEPKSSSHDFVCVTPKIPIQGKRVGTTTNGSKYRVTYKAAKWLSYQLYTYVASVDHQDRRNKIRNFGHCSHFRQMSGYALPVLFQVLLNDNLTRQSVGSHSLAMKINWELLLLWFEIAIQLHWKG